MSYKVKRVWNIISSVVVVMVALLAILLSGVRIFGITPYSILSPSMTPKYKVGSLVYTQRVDFDSISLGDSITFFYSDDVLVTHQVCEIDSEKKQFRTQGIANKDENGNIQKDGSPVSYKNVVGKVVFSVPYLGFISQYIQTESGIYVVSGLVVLLLIIGFVPEMVEFFKRKKLVKASAN